MDTKRLRTHKIVGGLIVALSLLPSCDDMAMELVHGLSSRPSFALLVSIQGDDIILDTSLADRDEDYVRTEYYEMCGGQDPYGNFDLIYEGPAISISVEPPPSSICPRIHYRAAVFKETCNDEGECSETKDWSTPKTFYYE